MTDSSGSRACMICGSKATAVWDPSPKGTHHIHVCHTCAPQALPMLIADAIYALNDQTVFQTLHTIERQFWKAIACRLLTEKQQWEAEE